MNLGHSEVARFRTDVDLQGAQRNGSHTLGVGIKAISHHFEYFRRPGWVEVLAVRGMESSWVLFLTGLTLRGE